MRSRDPVHRPAARVIVLDPAGRVLLLSFRDPGSDRIVWLTPGGGIVEGETPEAAARRELGEETGLIELEVGPCVWRRDQVFHWSGEPVRADEWFFLARSSDGRDPDLSGMDQDEAAAVREFRWWTPDEIEASGELFAPRTIASLLRPLIAGDIPTGPVNTGA